MKWIKFLVFAALFSVPLFGYVSEGDAHKLNRMSRTPAVTRLGTQLFQAQQFGMKGVYDVTLHGGLAGTQYKFRDHDGGYLQLPDNAIVTDCFYEIITAFDSANDSGGVTFTADSNGDLVNQSVAHTLSGINACDGPDDSTSSMVKLTASRYIIASIGSETQTAGKVNLWVEYVLSD